MKSIKLWILLMIASLGVQSAFSQVRSPLSINVDYSIAQPLGSLKNYTDKTSFRGWRAGLQYQLNDQLAIGLRSGFQEFYQRVPRAVYSDKGTDISAVQTRTLQVTPILATVQYQLTKPDAAIIPYVGLGVGTVNMLYNKYYGQFTDRDNSWQFAASPEIGVNIPFGKGSPLLFNASVQYSYSPYKQQEITSYNVLQANVGLRFHIN
ncbi:Outer membrane protein beta-barrel domain-containing protein [Chitinophaga sp. YR627]|uniref:outer membrane beta-barrel protein n=1 Tax=Chitinophaga sp. YR627 TaxID=1881041 RepID=UPI0008EAB4B6|nr:OmpW family outer membrane protein [Chitinophaga sp. YR627]SFN29602.1 Outer membrane protein beta-barrel domain-containing protein [Chitinophaga sp. YR627]